MFSVLSYWLKHAVLSVFTHVLKHHFPSMFCQSLKHAVLSMFPCSLGLAILKVLFLLIELHGTMRDLLLVQMRYTLRVFSLNETRCTLSILFLLEIRKISELSLSLKVCKHVRYDVHRELLSEGLTDKPLADCRSSATSTSVPGMTRIGSRFQEGVRNAILLCVLQFFKPCIWSYGYAAETCTYHMFSTLFSSLILLI